MAAVTPQGNPSRSEPPTPLETVRGIINDFTGGPVLGNDTKVIHLCVLTLLPIGTVSIITLYIGTDLIRWLQAAGAMLVLLIGVQIKNFVARSTQAKKHGRSCCCDHSTIATGKPGPQGPPNQGLGEVPGQ